MVDSSDALEEAAILPDHPFWAVGIGSQGTPGKVKIKYIEDMVLEELFQIHTTSCSPDRRCSRTTLTLQRVL